MSRWQDSNLRPPAPKADGFQLLLLLPFEALVNIAKNIANLKEVSHEISAATKPCSTAPGNKSGIVQAQSSFITKNAIATMPINKAINPGITASFFVFKLFD